MGLFDRFRKKQPDIREIEIAKRGGYAFQDIALPMSTYVQLSGMDTKVPLYRWSYQWVSDIYYGSDLLRTIVNTLNGETFKNGIQIRAKFVKKCTRCEEEFFEDVDKCPICGGAVRTPDIVQKSMLRNFIERKNRFNSSVFDMLKSGDVDCHIFDNAFFLLTRVYYYDESGKRIGAKITDVVRLAPDRIEMIMSSYGFGRNDMGEYAYVCPEHRETLVTYVDEAYYSCKICGKEMLPAWFAANSSGTGSLTSNNQKIYFGKGEIFHGKRWSTGEGFGVAPIYTVYRKLMTLIKMDDFTLEAYSLQRSPRTILVIRGRTDNIRQAWEYLSNKARENPTQPIPLILETTAEDAPKKIIEKVDLNLNPAEMQMMEMVKQMREQVGLVYGVQPMFSLGTGGGSVGGGLSNQGLQVAVTNRTIKDSQRVWNSALLWLSSSLGITDYVAELRSNENEEELSRVQLETERAKFAQMLKGFGFDVDLIYREDGTIDFRYKKVQSSLTAQMTEGAGMTPDQAEQIQGLNQETNQEGGEGGGGNGGE